MTQKKLVTTIFCAAFSASCGHDAKNEAKKPTVNETTACPSDTKSGSGSDMGNMGAASGSGGSSGSHDTMPGMGLSSDCSAAEGSQIVSPITKSAFYVVNGGGASLSVVDPDAKAVIATIALSGVSFPHHISLDVITDRLSVAVPGMDLSGGHEGSKAGMHGSLIVLDAKTGATEKTRALDAMNHNGVFSPDGLEIWTSAMAAPGSVLVLDSKTLEAKKTITVGDMPAEVTFSKDGMYAFVANGESGSVTVIDPKAKTVVKTIPVGEDPVGAWQGSDGVMYVDNEKGKSISAIDAMTLTVVRTYTLGFTPGMAATALNGELWVSDVDGGKITYFMPGETMKVGDIATGAGAHGIAFSADGVVAAVTNQMAGTVSLIDVKTHKLIQDVNVGEKPNGIVYRKQ